MQTTITGNHMEVTDALKNHVLEKMQRIERHFDHISSSNVVLQVEKTRHQAEATIHTKGSTLHANAESDNMYAAIDLLADKLDSQVRKRKQKVQDHHRSTGGIKHQTVEG